MLRVPHYLDNRLKDGGKVVSLTPRLRFAPQENYLINSWYSFLLEAELTPGPSAAGRIRSIEKNPMTSSGLEPTTFQLVA
jgi:hypothetical protein